MFESVPLPRYDVIAAKRLGVEYDLTLTSNAQEIAEGPILSPGGPLPLPEVPRLAQVGPGDSLWASDAKRAAIDSYARVDFRFRKAVDAITQAANDARMSDVGRKEKKVSAWNEFRNANGETMLRFEAAWAEVQGRVETACNAPDLDPVDAAGATQDAELRAIVRGMDGEARRIAYLMRETMVDPASRIVQAVLRGQPIASGLSREHYDVLSLRYGLQRNAKAIREAWGVALGLEAAAYMIYHGSHRVAAAAGQQYDGELRSIQARVDESPARHAVIVALDAAIEAVKTVSPDPDPEAKNVEAEEAVAA